SMAARRMRSRLVVPRAVSVGGGSVDACRAMLNECSFSGGELSSKPFAKVVDQRLIERIAHAAIDDFHHFRTIERCTDRIDVEMQMRRGGAELQQDGAIGAGCVEQRALSPMMHRREMRIFIGRKIGNILDMRFPNDDRMPA